MAHTLTLWTNDVEVAGWADAGGVDRIGIDLESVGKRERQGGLGTWISPYTIADLDRICPAVRHAELFVRLNPLHPGSREEVDAVLAREVGVIMLPNFTGADDVAAFLEIVAGRARVVPLVERLAAVDSIADLAALGVAEIHVGLNDLSLDMGLANRLAVLATPVMEDVASAARRAGLRLGVGGLGRAGDATLPVPSDLVYAQQARLGSTGALIARSFMRPDTNGLEFARDVAALRARLAWWSAAPPRELEAARRALADRTAVPKAVP